MTNLNFTVDKEKCIKCGLCVKDCIFQIIETDDSGYPCVRNESNCIACQHCFAVCPNGAISVFNKNSSEGEICFDKPSPEQLENLIKIRRSCRHYKQENVDEETLKKLKNILNYVPTGVNFRGLHFSIVEDKDKMANLKEKLYQKLRFFLKFIPLKGTINRYKKAILSGEDVIFRNAPHMIVVSADKKAPCANIDPIIALSYFEMYAQSLGLGTLWCGLAFATMPLSKDLMKELNIPKNYKLSYVMLFGYQNVSYSRPVKPDNYKIDIV